MAIGTKTGGSGFKKGDPRINRKGKPKLSPEQRALKDSYPKELARIIVETQYMTVPEIEARAKDMTLPALYGGFYQAMAMFRKTGDYNKYMSGIVERVLGKPKEFMDHSVKVKHIDLINAIKKLKN